MLYTCVCVYTFVLVVVLETIADTDAANVSFMTQMSGNSYESTFSRERMCVWDRSYNNQFMWTSTKVSECVCEWVFVFTLNINKLFCFYCCVCPASAAFVSSTQFVWICFVRFGSFVSNLLSAVGVALRLFVCQVIWSVELWLWGIQKNISCYFSFSVNNFWYTSSQTSSTYTSKHSSKH